MSSGQNAYWIPGAVIAASLLLGIGIALTPHSAGAFWPFSVTNAASGVDSPIIHDSSIDLLDAATNSDPNPSKGEGSIAMTEGSALISNAGPEGTVSDADHGSSGQISTYVVRDGDSISEIADTFNVSVSTILWANGLTAKSAINPGMKLVILPVSGVRHTVAKGETLAGIAKKYGADTSDIGSYNGVDEDASVAVGDVLIIPGGEIQAAATTKAKTSTTKTAAKSTIKTGGSLSSVQSNPFKGGSGAALPGYFGNPVPGGRLTQGVHGWNGVDIGAPSGTPVYAAAAGTVIVSRVGGWNGGYGNYVVIDHGNGTQSLYAHLSADSVSVGETVSKGETVGSVGKTGEATGFHLHFEVRGAKNPFAGCAAMSFCSPE
ncbi:MAG: putative rane bound lytic murein transglycosylase [Parcubacteria group bacterium]|nr:putative rane bound lytic murein transglycosylase [Parcubacteria group bacterium]